MSTSGKFEDWPQRAMEHMAAKAAKAKRYNVLAMVVEVVEAGSEEAASRDVNDRLRKAGFNPYEGASDLLPQDYPMAYRVEEGE